MRPISYGTEQPTDYATALSAVTNLAELRAVTKAYRLIASDADVAVSAMDDAAFARFIKARNSERRGKFSGEAAAREFGAIFMPWVMLRVSMIAGDLHVPWGLAYCRMKEVGMIAENNGVAVIVEPDPTDADEPTPSHHPTGS